VVNCPGAGPLALAFRCAAGAGNASRFISVGGFFDGFLRFFVTFFRFKPLHFEYIK
jgi:hypothetical protein